MRLSNVENNGATSGDPQAASSSEMPVSLPASREVVTLPVVSRRGSKATEASSKPGTPASRVPLPPLTDILDKALDSPGADLSHLMDPTVNPGGETPAQFVSRRGLQHAVEGLTDNFKSWLDAIHQSIVVSMQSKADSAQ